MGTFFNFQNTSLFILLKQGCLLLYVYLASSSTIIHQAYLHIWEEGKKMYSPKSIFMCILKVTKTTCIWTNIQGCPWRGAETHPQPRSCPRPASAHSTPALSISDSHYFPFPRPFPPWLEELSGGLTPAAGVGPPPRSLWQLGSAVTRLQPAPPCPAPSYVAQGSGVVWGQIAVLHDTTVKWSYLFRRWHNGLGRSVSCNSHCHWWVLGYAQPLLLALGPWQSPRLPWAP